MKKRSELEGGCGSQKSSTLEYDVGLGLKMQHTESYPCKKMMAMSYPPAYHHHQQPSTETSFEGGGGGGGGGGGSSYLNPSNQVTSVSGAYDSVGAGFVSGGPVLPRILHPFTIDSSFKSSGGGMLATGKVLFTASQWQELQRQTTIYKCLMASIPVPSELLIPITKSPSHVPVSPSNTSGLDLRVSIPSGSDAEPWRCRRTDGKKWRCSRDVAPDQKYCERHARKSRPRSRKPVEIQSLNTTENNNDNYTSHPLILPAYTTNQPFQKPISQFPTLVSATPYGQPRCIEWFVKGGTIPDSTSNQQWPQLMQSSSKLGLKGDHKDHGKSSSFYPQYYEEKHEPMNLNPHIDGCGVQIMENQQLVGCSLLNLKLACLQGSLNVDTSQTTRHFIDAWSTAEREEVNEISNKCSVSSPGKLPLSSLTLSMSGGNGIDEDNENAQIGIGMMDSDTGSGGVLKSQWLNPVSWLGSPPGGPLGEAMCLGIASTAKAASNVPSPRGYSNSTTSSSYSKSSSEDGGRGLHFSR